MIIGGAFLPLPRSSITGLLLFTLKSVSTSTFLEINLRTKLILFVHRLERYATMSSPTTPCAAFYLSLKRI